MCTKAPLAKKTELILLRQRRRRRLTFFISSKARGRTAALAFPGMGWAAVPSPVPGVDLETIGDPNPRGSGPLLTPKAPTLEAVLETVRELSADVSGVESAGDLAEMRR